MSSTIAFRTLLLTVFFSAVFLLSGTNVSAEVKPGNSTINNIPKLYYYWDNVPQTHNSDNVPLTIKTVSQMFPCSPLWPYLCNGGMAAGLARGANATLNYNVRLIDLETGREISDNATLAVDKQFRVERVFTDPRNPNHDIFWNGTGLSSDSPYGRWVSNAGPVRDSCKTADKVADFGSLRVHVLLNVAPPVQTIVSSGPVSCNNATKVCTVTGSGDITAGLRFERTDGRFYYRYWMNGSGGLFAGCQADNQPMWRGPLPGYTIRGVPIDGCHGEDCKNTGGQVYTASFPPETITFNLTGQDPNNIPSKPAISMTNPRDLWALEQGTFNFVSSDPDGDQVRYEINWNNGVVPQDNIQADGVSTVPQGVTQSLNHAWPAPAGTYYIRAQAVDSNDGSSGWTDPFPVVIKSRPEVTALPTTNIIDDRATIHGNVDAHNTPTDVWFRYDTTNPITCTDDFGARVDPAPSTFNGVTGENFAYDLSGLTPNTTYYYCAFGEYSGTPTVPTVVRSFTSAPATPTGLDGAPGTCDQQEVDLTWNFSAGATTYQIAIDGNVGSPENTGNVLAYTVSGLGTDQPHTFQVQAGNGTGWSAWSPATPVINSSPACLPDFSEPTAPDPTISLIYDDVSLTYDVEFTFNINTQNVGDASTGEDAEYAVLLDLNDDGDFDDAEEEQTGTIPAGLSYVVGSNSFSQNAPTFTATYTTYPNSIFGPMNVRLEVDRTVDDSPACTNPTVINGAVDEKDECDNYREYQINVDAPDPVLDIRASKNIIRGTDLFDLEWEVGIPYKDLICDLSGPGVNITNFNPNADVDPIKAGIQIDPTLNNDVDGSNPPYNGVVTDVGPIDAKSVYTFRCIEQITKTEFTDSTTVNFLGEPEEI